MDKSFLSKSWYVLFVESKHRSSHWLLAVLWLIVRPLLERPKILHFPCWDDALKFSLIKKKKPQPPPKTILLLHLSLKMLLQKLVGFAI